MFKFTTSGVRPCENDWGGPAIAESTSAVVGFMTGYGTGSGAFSGCARTGTSSRSPDYIWLTLLDDQLWWYQGLGVPWCNDRGTYFTCDGLVIK